MPMEVEDDFAASPFGFVAFCSHCWARDAEIVPVVACNEQTCPEPNTLAGALAVELGVILWALREEST